MKTTRILLAVSASVLIASCGGRQTATETSAGSSATRASHDPKDPCSLLERAEVEAVTGPLAGPPFRTHEGSDLVEPVQGGDACAYETPDFRSILLSVTWKDGAVALKAVTLPGRLAAGVTANAPENAGKAAKTLLPGGLQLAGEWDEAQSLGCCQIFALRGDSLVTFDYRGWRDDTPHAVAILNKALVRLEHPLSVDGNAGNDAARQRAAQRPKPRPACSLLARAEAEAIVGPLAADPHPNGNDDSQSCVYRYTQQASKESPLNDAPKEFKSMLGAVTGGRGGMVTGPVDAGIQIAWRGGFRQLNDAALVGGAVGANFEGMPGMPKRKTGKVEGGPWDEAGQTSLTFTAVKRDVAITIDTDPMLSPEQVELRRRMVAKIVEKIAPKE